MTRFEGKSAIVIGGEGPGGGWKQWLPVGRQGRADEVAGHACAIDGGWLTV